MEDRLGRLAPGMWADLVVLSRDIRAADPARLAETRVDLTMVEGVVAYQRERPR